MPYFEQSFTNAGSAGNRTRETSGPSFVFTGRVTEIYTDYKIIDGLDVYPPGSISVIAEGGGRKKPIKVFPFDELTNTIPVLNELVDVYTLSNVFFYRRRNFSETINNSYDENQKANTQSSISPSKNPTDYKSQTLRSDSNPNSLNAKINSNDNAFKDQYINRLKYYDGDTLIQSRFGQSIRFSAYNNLDGEPHPTIILRNVQSEKSNTKSGYTAIEEDVNEDGSTIAISSGEYKSDFVPGVVKSERGDGQQTNQNGRKKPKKKDTDFYVKPWTKDKEWAFTSYPKELNGNQIVITSDRLILSSRRNEMMFFSKGNMALMADSNFSMDVKDDISIVSHEKGFIDIESKGGQVHIHCGPGPIGRTEARGVYLGFPNGSQKAERALKGQQLADAIGELANIMIELANGGVLTPAGPTAGLRPDIQTKLQDVLRKATTSCLSETVFIY